MQRISYQHALLYLFHKPASSGSGGEGEIQAIISSPPPPKTVPAIEISGKYYLTDIQSTFPLCINKPQFSMSNVTITSKLFWVISWLGG